MNTTQIAVLAVAIGSWGCQASNDVAESTPTGECAEVLREMTLGSTRITLLLGGGQSLKTNYPPLKRKLLADIEAVKRSCREQKARAAAANAEQLVHDADLMLIEDPRSQRELEDQAAALAAEADRLRREIEQDRARLVPLDEETAGTLRQVLETEVLAESGYRGIRQAKYDSALRATNLTVALDPVTDRKGIVLWPLPQTVAVGRTLRLQLRVSSGLVGTRWAIGIYVGHPRAAKKVVDFGPTVAMANVGTSELQVRVTNDPGRRQQWLSLGVEAGATRAYSGTAEAVLKF